jgi:hypothetical protein
MLSVVRLNVTAPIKRRTEYRAKIIALRFEDKGNSGASLD